jgi:hydroxymethylpyrimidine/phosphomethylpyrimidine kinase
VLIPRADIITPNLPEAAALLDAPLADSEGAIEAQGKSLLALGCRAVLIKGGHGHGVESIDYFVTLDRTVALPAKRVATRNTHGTGCTLSSAIAAFLARGKTMDDAVRAAKDYVTAAIASADRFSVGHGHGPVHHFHNYYG